ncbi:MAG: cache domain-containing protein, partial [Synergistaceae bacterium]
MSLDKKELSKYNALYIFFISTLIFMVVIIVTRVDYNNTRIRATARTEEVLASSALEQTQLFIAKLDGQYRILKTTAAALSLMKNRQSGDEIEFLNTLLKDSGFYITGIADENGNAKLSNSEKANIRTRWYFKENMAGRNAIERIDKALLNRESFFVISVPVFTNGKPTGAVIGIYDEDKFSSLLIQQAYKEKGYSFVCASSGELVIGTRHTNSAWIHLNQQPVMNDNFITKISQNPDNSSVVEQLKEDFALQKSGTARYRPVGGTGRIAFYHPIGINGWYIFSVVTTDVIEESVEMETKDARMLYCVIILTSIILIIMVLTLERKNVRQITEDRKKLKASEEEYRIAAAHSGKAILRYEPSLKRLTTSK